MARPRSKEQLLAEIDRERKALEDLLAGLPLEALTRPGVVGRWSVKDVLAHLVEWEQMFLGWYAAGLDHQIPALPAEGFHWGQLPQLNQAIYERHHAETLAAVQKRFGASYRKLHRTIERLDPEDLFEPGRFAWTGTHALLSFIVPNTSSHYRWAREAIAKGLHAPRQTRPARKTREPAR
jgi:uncharacterized protein (TIGR03083 family)